MTPARKVSTFERARKLLGTISGRREYTDPGEKFESVTMLLFQPVTHDAAVAPWVRLIDTISNRQMTDQEYFDMIRQCYNKRNPHTAIGENILEEDDF